MKWRLGFLWNEALGFYFGVTNDLCPSRIKIPNLKKVLTDLNSEMNNFHFYIFISLLFHCLRVFHTSVGWWSLNQVQVTASLLRSLGLVQYSGRSQQRCNLDVRGEFNKFPDFFVQAFKIVVHSWKFSMLLLYILWDDWPIFMISSSNQQLQQQLEYTLLKLDCLSWWISKMQSDTLEERYAIKFCFKLGKNSK